VAAGRSGSAPAGWPRVASQELPGGDAVQQYVYGHPDVFGSIPAAYPDPGSYLPQVLLVTTTGDVAAATRIARRSYAGPLCVRKVPHSRAQALAARAVIGSALAGPAAMARYDVLEQGGIGNAPDGDPRTCLRVAVWTEDVEALRQAAGADVVDVVEVQPVLAKQR
jgi:hypothetical protein